MSDKEEEEGQPVAQIMIKKYFGGRVQGAGFRLSCSKHFGSRVQGAGFRFQGSELRVQGAGFRCQGVGVKL